MAAGAKRDEQVAEAIVQEQRRAFHDAAVWPVRKIERRGCGAQQHAGDRVDLPLLNTGPEAAIGHPDAPVPIHEDVRVDGVEVVAGA